MKLKKIMRRGRLADSPEVGEIPVENSDRLTTFETAGKTAIDGSQSLGPRMIELPQRETMNVPAELLRLPRKERMNNQTFSNLAGARLQRPDPELMFSLSASDDRIRHFDVMKASDFEQTDVKLNGLPEYYQLFAPKLAQRIADDFPDQKLAIRGITTSVNGAVPIDPYTTILDIEDVLRTGDETLRGWIRVGGFSQEHSPSSDQPIHSRVAEALPKTALFRRDVEEIDPGRSASVFPALLVYDADNLTDSSFGYRTSVKNPDQADQAIIAAYVLDFPMPDQS